MKSMITSAVLAAVLAGATTAASAGDITLAHPWSRATPAGAQVGAGYVTLENSGSTADRLVSATADAADHAEIHEMAMNNGVMQMRPVKELEIPAGKRVELRPGGYHIMFMGLNHQLKAGDAVKGSLTFEKAGTMPVEFKVEAMGADGASGHSAH